MCSYLFSLISLLSSLFSLLSSLLSLLSSPFPLKLFFLVICSIPVLGDERREGEMRGFCAIPNEASLRYYEHADDDVK